MNPDEQERGHKVSPGNVEKRQGNNQDNKVRNDSVDSPRRKTEDGGFAYDEKNKSDKKK